jgi:hypothetical protein
MHPPKSHVIAVCSNMPHFPIKSGGLAKDTYVEKNTSKGHIPSTEVPGINCPPKLKN